jgi:ComF family protein
VRYLRSPQRVGSWVAACVRGTLTHGPRAGQWLGAGLNLVFPPECASCRAPIAAAGEALLCIACRDALVDAPPGCRRCGASAASDESGSCPRCRDSRFYFESVVRLGAYDKALRSAVLRVKDHRHRGLAMALGDLLGTCRGAALASWKPDAVLAVPMHWTRRMRRGVNSPQVIAERLAARLGIPVASHLLVRHRRTAPQASLPPGKRRANVRGAFRARPHRDLAGARLLLVDDVMTTGATLNEAARTLSRAGAAWLGVAVLARADGLP